VIGVVGATVGLILKLILLPFIILTLGVVYFLITGLLLKLASEFVPGFRVNGCLPVVHSRLLSRGSVARSSVRHSEDQGAEGVIP